MVTTGGEDRPEGDSSIENHPDLSNPEWATRVEREFAAAQRAGRKQREKPYQSEWGRPNRYRLGAKSWIAIFVLFVAVAAVLGSLNLSSSGGDKYRPSGPLGSAGNQPSGTGLNQDGTLNLAQPFARTPAANWADGANGIVLPAPAPVGSWSAQQVATAEQDVKQAVIAAFLDNTMLVNHDPSAYLATLAPGTRAAAAADLAKPGRQDAGEVTRLAPGFHLLPVPIKVNGTMTASLGDHGNPQINANYVFAYPFAPNPGIQVSQPSQIVSVVHIDTNYTVILGSNYRTADHGVWMTNGQVYDYQMSCSADANGLLAPYYSDEQQNGPVMTENPDAPYDPNHSMNIPNPGCRG